MRHWIIAATILGQCISPALAAGTIDTDRIVSAATGDFDKDESADLAMIVAPAADTPDDFDVYLFLSDSENGSLRLKTKALNKVWGNTGMFGQLPFLTAQDNGSIVITSHNEAVGREHWERKVTVAYRNGDFVVAGYTYSSYDTLEPDSTTDCDVNMLTGKGTSNGEPVAAKGQTIPLTDWEDAQGAAVCGIE